MEQARQMKAALNREIKSVGVFVNADIEYAAEAANSGILDVLQLHGDEDESYILRLQKLTDKPIIKAVRVQCREDILKAQKLSCEYLLLDTWQKGQYGGSGVSFSWDLIPKLEKPYFLAGGLNAQNVGEAIKEYHPFAVDVSSAVETEGKKDAVKIKEFIEQVRGRKNE